MRSLSTEHICSHAVFNSFLLVLLVTLRSKRSISQSFNELMERPKSHIWFRFTVTACHSAARLFNRKISTVTAGVISPTLEDSRSRDISNAYSLRVQTQTRANRGTSLHQLGANIANDFQTCFPPVLERNELN